MQQYNITICVVNLYNFEGLAFIKAFKKIIAQLTYKIQYVIEGRLTDGKRLKIFRRILKKYIDYLNNNKTCLIGISLVHAITLKEVESKPSKKPKHAIGKDEKIKLQKGIVVRYLLKVDELEEDYRHKATDSY